MSAPIDRTRLAAVLRSQWSARSLIGQYVAGAEDTIEAQATMLRADLTDCADLRREIARLRTEVLTLRQLAEAALIAVELDDGGEAIDIIRQALEKTT